jgi:hypothetical protein
MTRENIVRKAVLRLMEKESPVDRAVRLYKQLSTEMQKEFQRMLKEHIKKEE